ncbi:toxin-antitoxin system YwqK family antitoxin [Chryseobacterium terrae]|uniref:Uncharacterized protein n=1 Tax=Chryseobacterium terrae TaxID=3163299 RepID=A0ABW8Y0E6_9FLAO
MQKRLSPIISFPFLLCLGLLILNDFYLKTTYHNLVTGKLSDLCGLFIFPIFWSVLLPKYRSGIFIATALFFVYWKSTYSQPFIDFFSETFFVIERTVDLTDLFALPILFAAWFSLNRNQHKTALTLWQKRINPYIIAAIAIFSFYSTSKARHTQRFDQPQYVLLKTDNLIDTIDYEHLQYYRFDSLLVVKIEEIDLSKHPIKYDDYNKNAAIKNLDYSISQMLGNGVHLINPGTITYLNIKTPEGVDSVRFNGGRLDGKFIRKKNGRIIIAGLYKNGIEDSIWAFQNDNGELSGKVTFVNGERTKIQLFKNNSVIKTDHINTRKEVVRYKLIQIVILIFLFTGIAFVLIKNYRQAAEKLQMKKLWKWILCIVLPLVVWCIHFAVTLLLGNYHYDIFIVYGTAILTYLITCPLFFITVFGIQLRKQIDLLWYTLLFALAFSIWIEIDIYLELAV